VSAGGFAYIADAFDERVLVTGFNGDNLTPLGSFGSTALFPASIAWDGGTTPLSTENLYVLDPSHAAVTYWVNAGSSWNMAWTFGTPGGETGQLRDPSAVCVGRGGSPNGGATFTTDFYIADAGNHRIVWLRRSGASAQVIGERELDYDGVPSDCTVEQRLRLRFAQQQADQVHVESR
jgi:hypothetical protein